MSERSERTHRHGHFAHWCRVAPTVQPRRSMTGCTDERAAEGDTLMSKCRVCRGPAIIDLPRHNANFCAEHLQQLCRRQVEKAIGDFDMLAARRPRPRRRQRRQGLAGGVGPADRARLPGRRAVRRARASASTATTAARYASAFAAERGLTLRDARPARRVRLRHADGGPGDAAGAVLGVRAVQAPPVRQGRARRRLRRRRHRPQPRRRGGRAARQHVALGRSTTSPASCPVLPARQRLPAEGQAARAAHRAGDGGVVHRPRHRLPGRGVPDGGGQPAPRVQGDAQRRSRRDVAGHEGVVLPQLPRADGAAARRPVARRRRRARPRARACGAPTTGDVCAFCRLVETASAHEPVPVEMVAGPVAR